jgi:exonuclease III
MYLNARSIVNKHSELELYLIEENIDIVGITETWLTDSVSDSEMSIEGYTLLRGDRKSETKQRGGGVALYIKNDIDFVAREEINGTEFAETIWCSINCSAEKTLIGVCYRAPDSKQKDDAALYSVIDRASKLKEKLIIMGDFNYPELNWSLQEKIDENHPFIECISNNFLSQIIEEPTRGSNFLDLVLCSEVSIIQNIYIGEPFETSDHQLIRFKIMAKKLNTKTINRKYNYYKADYSEIRKEVQSKSEEVELEKMGLEYKWVNMKSVLSLVRNKFIPLSKTRENKCKWVTKTVTRCRKAKKKAWLKYKNSDKDPQLYNTYKTKLNQSVLENNKAKLAFEEKLASNIKNDSKSFYAYANSKKRTKERVGPLKDSQGNISKTNKDTADLLNKYFSSVFTKEDTNFIPVAVSNFNYDNYEPLAEITIDEELVFEKLSKINTNKSQGPDEINPKNVV